MFSAGGTVPAYLHTEQNRGCITGSNRLLLSEAQPEPDLNSSGVEEVLEDVNELGQSSEMSGLFAEDDGLSQDQTFQSRLFPFPGLDALNTGPDFAMRTIYKTEGGKGWEGR